MSRGIDIRTLDILEFPAILEQAAEYTRTAAGRLRMIRLPAIHDRRDLENKLAHVTEAAACIAFDDPIPAYGFSDMEPIFERTSVLGSSLSVEDFLQVRQFLASIRILYHYFSERHEKYSRLFKMAGSLTPHPDLEKSIDRVVGSDGEIRDDASQALQKIRRALLNASAKIRKQLMSMMQMLSAQGYTQENQMALRNGRLVIPLKEAYRNQVNGVIVDQSASGSTVFVEPIETLQANNEVSRLKHEEKQEVNRILTALTAEIREELDSITRDHGTAGVLDTILARGYFSHTMAGSPAAVTEARLHLENARHPLLMTRLPKESVIPLNITLGEGWKTIVITGPNAGGKTVALKTVGLLAAMHQHGFHVPAGEKSEIPVFDTISADIGDRQSIEQDLSTFSSHMESMKEILEKSGPHSLVLLDEIGAATDPAEGTALAEAILRHLTKEGCLTVATTHMGRLKVFAHEEDGVENGSMAFDRDTLKPTYQFQIGLPGSSYAFEIASRLGLPNDIIAEAKILVGDERGQIEKLIFHLEQELQKARKLLNEAELKESRLSGLVTLYKDKLKQLEIGGEEKKSEITREAETILNETNVLIENLVREIRESQAKPEIVKKTKAEITAQKKKVRSLKKPESPVLKTINIGDWVSWEGHGGSGLVLSKPDRTGRIMVDWEGVKMRLPLSRLKQGEGPKKQKKKAVFTGYQAETRVGDEIDLRGFTADEAVVAADKYLGEAAASGINLVRIIHGKGTGVLRTEIDSLLQDHPLVKRHRLGNWNEGDTGVTIVELA